MKILVKATFVNHGLEALKNKILKEKRTISPTCNFPLEPPIAKVKGQSSENDMENTAPWHDILKSLSHKYIDNNLRTK